MCQSLTFINPDFCNRTNLVYVLTDQSRKKIQQKLSMLLLYSPLKLLMIAYNTDVCIIFNDHCSIIKTLAFVTKEIAMIRLLCLTPQLIAKQMFFFCFSLIVISPEKYGKFRFFFYKLSVRNDQKWISFQILMHEYLRITSRGNAFSAANIEEANIVLYWCKANQSCLWKNTSVWKQNKKCIVAFFYFYFVLRFEFYFVFSFGSQNRIIRYGHS